jgi:hypothetical protein
MENLEKFLPKLVILGDNVLLFIEKSSMSVGHK